MSRLWELPVTPVSPLRTLGDAAWALLVLCGELEGGEGSGHFRAEIGRGGRGQEGRSRGRGAWKERGAACLQRERAACRFHTAPSFVLDPDGPTGHGQETERPGLAALLSGLHAGMACAQVGLGSRSSAW